MVATVKASDITVAKSLVNSGPFFLLFCITSLAKYMNINLIGTRTETINWQNITMLLYIHFRSFWKRWTTLWYKFSWIMVKQKCMQPGESVSLGRYMYVVILKFTCAWFQVLFCIFCSSHEFGSKCYFEVHDIHFHGVIIT